MSTNFGDGALESEGDLLGLLGLLSEDGLSLTTVVSLLRGVATSTLSLLGVLALLVLSNLHVPVLLAHFAVRVNVLRSVLAHMGSSQLTHVDRLVAPEVPRQRAHRLRPQRPVPAVVVAVDGGVAGAAARARELQRH